MIKASGVKNGGPSPVVGAGAGVVVVGVEDVGGGAVPTDKEIVILKRASDSETQPNTYEPAEDGAVNVTVPDVPLAVG